MDTIFNYGNPKVFFILGAMDPEMKAIEEILQSSRSKWIGIKFAYACVGDRQVFSGNAYKADSTSEPIPEGSNVVTVECSVAGITPYKKCDHHHPGDFGYGRGPEQFWEASSIGQVCDFLGLKPTEEFLLVAASDHCPAHAYKGKCPGVDPDALMKHRLLIKSAFQKRSLEEIMADVTSTMSLIQKKLDAGDAVPHFPLEEKAAELPEASLRVGVPITYELEGNERYPRVKVGMLNGTPELLREWMIVTAPAMGLVDIYGDPERGYAGGYIPSV